MKMHSDPQKLDRKVSIHLIVTIALVIAVLWPAARAGATSCSKLSVPTEFEGAESMLFIEATQPRVVILSEEGLVFADQIKQVSPDTVIVGRLPETRFLTKRIGVGNPVESARKWWNANAGNILAYQSVDYWEGYRFSSVDTQALSQWVNAFEETRIELLAANGRQACALNLEAEPSFSKEVHWSTLLPAIDAALENDGALCLWEPAGRGVPEQTPLPLSYRDVYRHLEGREIPLILTEVHVTVDQLAQFDEQLLADSYVLGAVILLEEGEEALQQVTDHLTSCPADPLGDSGHVTNLCGYPLPIPSGLVGYSIGACAHTCYSSWTSGYCDNVSGRRIIVFGCAGKTNGAACDGGTNGGIVLADETTYPKRYSFSEFWDRYPEYCTFQIDVFDYVNNVNTDHIIWERDECTPQPPTCSLNADCDYMPSSGEIPLTVQFSDNSTANNCSIVSRTWDLNDDGTTDSTAKNPTYTYTAPGTYRAKLTVKADDGTTATARCPVNAMWTVTCDGDPTCGEPPLTVGFSATSGGLPIDTWAWNFGDGSAIVSDPSPVSHTYESVGDYNPTVEVSSGSLSQVVSCPLVSVGEVIPMCGAEPTSGIVPLEVQFTDLSETNNATIVYWGWDFDGDGVIDFVGQNPPPYTYTEPGTYTPTLTIVDDCDAIEKTVECPQITPWDCEDFTCGLFGQNNSLLSIDPLNLSEVFDCTPPNPSWGPSGIEIISISQDEPLQGCGSGNKCPDGGGVGGGIAMIRLESCSMSGYDGRVYHIEYAASDDNGGRCEGMIDFCIPHDNSPSSAVCGDQGPLYDSTDCNACVSPPGPGPDPDLCN